MIWFLDLADALEECLAADAAVRRRQRPAARLGNLLAAVGAALGSAQIERGAARLRLEPVGEVGFLLLLRAIGGIHQPRLNSAPTDSSIEGADSPAASFLSSLRALT